MARLGTTKAVARQVWRQRTSDWSSFFDKWSAVASESIAPEGEDDQDETLGIEDEEEWIAFPAENGGQNIELDNASDVVESDGEDDDDLFEYLQDEAGDPDQRDADSVISFSTTLNHSETAGSSKANMSILERSQKEMYETFVETFVHKLNREYEVENQETADDVATLLDGIIESRQNYSSPPLAPLVCQKSCNRPNDVCKVQELPAVAQNFASASAGVSLVDQNVGAKIKDRLYLSRTNENCGPNQEEGYAACEECGEFAFRPKRDALSERPFYCMKCLVKIAGHADCEVEDCEDCHHLVNVYKSREIALEQFNSKQKTTELATYSVVNFCSRCQTAKVEDTNSLCSECKPDLTCEYCGRESLQKICRQCSDKYCQYRTDSRDFSYSADTTLVDTSRSLIHDQSDNYGLVSHTADVLDKNCFVCNPKLLADGNQHICSTCAGGHEDCTEPHCNFCKEIAERTLEALNLTDLTLGSGLAFESPYKACRDSSFNATEKQSSRKLSSGATSALSTPLQERHFQEATPFSASTATSSSRRLVLKKSVTQRSHCSGEGENDANKELSLAGQGLSTAPKMSTQPQPRPRLHLEFLHSRTPTKQSANYHSFYVESARGDATFSMQTSPSKRSKRGVDPHEKCQQGQRFFFGS